MSTTNLDKPRQDLHGNKFSFLNFEVILTMSLEARQRWGSENSVQTRLSFDCLLIMTGPWFKNYDLWTFFYYDRINANINNGLNISAINQMNFATDTVRSFLQLEAWKRETVAFSIITCLNELFYANKTSVIVSL